MAGQASTQLSFSVFENIGFWLTVMSKFSCCPFPRCLCCHGYIIISESRDWAFCRTQWYDDELSKKDLIVLKTEKVMKDLGSIISLFCFPNSSSTQRVCRQMLLFYILSPILSSIYVRAVIAMVQQHVRPSHMSCYCRGHPQGGAIYKKETGTWLSSFLCLTFSYCQILLLVLNYGYVYTFERKKKASNTHCAH